MTAPLAGRVALVTDAHLAIGAVIARALAEAGASVLAHAPAPDAAAAVAARLPGVPGAHRGLAAPLDERAAVDAMLQSLGTGADILVHTSCPQHLAPLEDFPDQMLDRILETGFVSYFRLARALLPAMRARGYGRLIVMSSVQGLVGSVEKSAYVAAKHAVVGFTKAVALETAGSGVTANAFCPGWTGTEGTRAQAAVLAARRGVSPEVALADMLKEKHPSNRFVAPDALGALVAFLCRPEAAQITGAALPVDGGWTAR